jgi:DmsE family decaheme c-type cytochrome
VAAFLLMTALLASALSGTLSSAPMMAQATPPAAAKPDQPKAPLKAEYATSIVCQGCHEEIYNAFFKRNPHRTLETNKKRGWEEKACESCHGMGSIHAESVSPADILQPAKIRPAAADRMCLTCHLNQQTQVGRVMGGHARSQVACVSCHSVHATPGPALLPGSLQSAPSPRVQVQTGTCITCHATAWAEFQKPHRHNLPEGAMTCSDCHNPHGGTNRTAMLNTGMGEPGCFRCHTDKRGPFTFEHAPVRLEGCQSCHQPHGSANPHMLTRHEVRFQCLECHSNVTAAAGVQSAPSGGLGAVPPAFHDLRSPRYRNCTTCHWKIHGSHVDPNFTR